MEVTSYIEKIDELEKRIECLGALEYNKDVENIKIILMQIIHLINQQQTLMSATIRLIKLKINNE